MRAIRATFDLQDNGAVHQAVEVEHRDLARRGSGWCLRHVCSGGEGVAGSGGDGSDPTDVHDVGDVLPWSQADERVGTPSPGAVGDEVMRDEPLAGGQPQ